MLVKCNKGTGNEAKSKKVPRAEECDLHLEEFI